MTINRYGKSKIIKAGKLIHISISHNYLFFPLVRACEIHSLGKLPVFSTVLLTAVFMSHVRCQNFFILQGWNFETFDQYLSEYLTFLPWCPPCYSMLRRNSHVLRPSETPQTPLFMASEGSRQVVTLSAHNEQKRAGKFPSWPQLKSEEWLSKMAV